MKAAVTEVFGSASGEGEELPHGGKCGDSRQRLSDGFACMVALALAEALDGRQRRRHEMRFVERLRAGWRKVKGGGRDATENQLSLSMALVHTVAVKLDP